MSRCGCRNDITDFTRLYRNITIKRPGALHFTKGVYVAVVQGWGAGSGSEGALWEGPG